MEVWRLCLIYGLSSLFPYSAFGGDFWKVPLREKDLKRFLLLSPNAPRIWLALLVRDRVRDAYWNDLELARLNLVALDTLRELDLEWRGDGFDIPGGVPVEH